MLHRSPVSAPRITGNYIPVTSLSQTLISKSSIWLNTNTQYMSGIKIANENTTNGVSGEPSKYLCHLFFYSFLTPSATQWAVCLVLIAVSLRFPDHQHISLPGNPAARFL